MTISRSELIGKKVYSLEAAVVGDVTDIGFSIGESQATLIVRAADGSMLDIPWDSVTSAKDIVLLKAGVDPSKFRRAGQAAAAAPVQVQAQTPAASSDGKKFCTSCGKPLTWIAEYKRWYCYNEKKYV